MNFPHKPCIVFSLNPDPRKYSLKKHLQMCWSNSNANNKMSALYNNKILSLILTYTISFKPY